MTTPRLQKGMRILDADGAPCVIEGFHRERSWAFRRPFTAVFVIARYVDDTTSFLGVGTVVVDGSEGSDA